MQALFRSILMTSLFLAYPYLVYRGMDSGRVWLAPAIFSGLYIYQAVTVRNPRVKAIKLLFALSLLLGAIFLQALTAKLMPVAIQLFLMWFFGKTLIKGPPIIESFVRLEYPVFIPGITEYCRQLTIMWTGFFAFNAVICAVLAIWGSSSWWAIYTGILIFILTGVLMIGEYIYRHYRFPDMEIASIRSTIQTMVTNGRGIWLDVHGRR